MATLQTVLEIKHISRIFLNGWVAVFLVYHIGHKLDCRHQTPVPLTAEDV